MIAYGHQHLTQQPMVKCITERVGFSCRKGIDFRGKLNCIGGGDVSALEACSKAYFSMGDHGYSELAVAISCVIVINEFYLRNCQRWVSFRNINETVQRFAMHLPLIGKSPWLPNKTFGPEIHRFQCASSQWFHWNESWQPQRVEDMESRCL